MAGLHARLAVRATADRLGDLHHADGLVEVPPGRIHQDGQEVIALLPLGLDEGDEGDPTGVPAD